MRAPPVVALAMLSAFRTASAEPCPPRAELGGDNAAVARVAAELQRLGVTVQAQTETRRADGCAIVRARVELDEGGGIAVAVRGAMRGSEGRVVSDAALAAAWIDSWTREDVDVALWAAPAVATRAEPAVVDAPAGVVDAPVVVPAPSRWERIAISASYEQHWTDDDAAWSGFGASVCARVGGFCLGGRARFAYDGARLYNATGVARDDVTLLATASYPVSVGTMSIAPELGFGIGRMTTARADATCKMMEPPPNCDPMDPGCAPMPGTCEQPNPDGTTMTPKVYVGDNFEAATYSPRISLALRIAVPLFEHVWLDGLAGMTYSPFGHTSSFAADAMNHIVSPDLLALPGEPTSGYVLGIGIRVGAR